LLGAKTDGHPDGSWEKAEGGKTREKTRRTVSSREYLITSVYTCLNQLASKYSIMIVLHSIHWVYHVLSLLLTTTTTNINNNNHCDNRPRGCISRENMTQYDTT
jgi:hypothetical protein